MSGTAPVFIGTDAVEQVLTWDALVAALRDAYAQRHDEHISPPRTFARGDGASLRALASVPPGKRFMGAKVFGRGRNRGMNYLISLADQDTGEIRALLDANKITAYRTAATSALAVDCLAPRRPVRLGVLGSGAEARAHVQAIASLRQIEGLSIYSPTPANRERFAHDFEAMLGVPCRPAATAAQAMEGADIGIAAARSRDETPILHADALRDGMVLVSVGSTLPQQREIDASVVERCDLIVCDMPDEVSTESGDMLEARARGIDFAPRLRSLNQLVRGEIAPGARLPMFKSVGSALQDIVAAELVFDLATGAGLAVELPIAFTYKQ
ncbi:MAG: ornithine cyclodeaminase family protein [Alcaligenaceae bacterium]|nr:ornithine cyclodeaminase family protein [Alcaligenaceae bacterium SAGV5]MPS55036.1 ornithine cyclodeaminase family protein [Alcaligenaceae bacterium SAGV3]MPT59045.1 ornithine cyclodeaminase family protein [Alcaligenaceae bacterium]